jgi:hypothetical protein
MKAKAPRTAKIAASEPTAREDLDEQTKNDIDAHGTRVHFSTEAPNDEPAVPARPWDDNPDVEA